MKPTGLFIFLFSFLSGMSPAQDNINWEGQLSLLGSYSPDNDLDVFTGGRYIPEITYAISLDSTTTLDFKGAVNMEASVGFHPFSESNWDADVDPYRAWARLTGRQYEFRLGLQKIDFGVAQLLRPLQWFNQIDPRDPLQLTNGVYGLLGRYYFLNNANIWVWGLYGNEEARGFDVVGTYEKQPEFGARVQHPVPAGEIGFSYHHRTASSSGMPGLPTYEKIPENRFGLDAKWDIEIGLWMEASYIHKTQDLGALTNQTLFTLGADYTFALGNGLNVVAEHLISSYDKDAFQFTENTNFSALNTSYPLGLFDNINTVLYQDWENDNFTFFLNYEHQFTKLTGYVMAYYNPETQRGIQDNELLNTFEGPGVRFMLVYNH